MISTDKRSKLMFDVRPVKTRVNLEIGTEINLSEKSQIEEPHLVDSQINDLSLDYLISNILKEKVPSHEELVTTLQQESDPLVELASMGATFNRDFRPASPIDQPILASYGSQSFNYKSEEDELHRRIIEKIREPFSSRVAKSIAKSDPKPIGEPAIGFIKREEVISNKVAMVADFYNKPRITVTKGTFVKMPLVNFKSKPLNFSLAKRKRFPHKWILILIVLGLLAYGLTLKNELVRESFSAIDNLQQARESLENYNFAGAAKNFDDSYNDFTRASQNLNMMSAGLANIFGGIPGLGKLKSAKDIVEAGKLLTGAGQAMSEALSSLSKTGAILNPGDKDKIKPSKMVAQIKNALELSDKNLQKAKILLSDIDDSVIPEDKRDNFHDFKDKIPLFEQYLGDAIEYADFLEGIVGIDEPKKYLLLFENNSELRPTGGFSGTYGVVSFASGGLSDFFVNDVYNLDGQLKRNIIPPKQLQHITPNWGMRDSAWFIDFPTSAKKAEWFFEQEAGYGVNGVITVNPDVVSAILGIVGPIKLPIYDLTLTADNFVESIQEEVEYGPNRTQPKQVVSDFAPLFLEKLYSADSEKWMQIFNVLMAGLDEKDILFYFNEKYLEEFSIKKGYGGEIKNTNSDYMMVTFSNVKGSKTDVVTDSDIDIENRIEAGRVIHKVALSRQHNGGDDKHGFYNRQNPAYVRVLLPEDSELISVSGNDNPNFRPLMDYNSQFGFERDSELSKYESRFYFDKILGVDKFEESGKNGIGFWMITDPGTSKTVEFEYATSIPDGDYDFYFQKQPGLDWNNFKFSIQDSENLSIADSFPPMNRIGDMYILDAEVKKDLEINIKFK